MLWLRHIDRRISCCSLCTERLGTSFHLLSAIHSLCYSAHILKIVSILHPPFLSLPVLQGPFLVPADEFCVRHADTTKPCSRPDLFAFQVSSGLALTYCAWIGSYCWYITRRAHTNIPQTPEGRLYKYLWESEKLAAVSFTFQLWDFFISLLIPEHSTAIMLTHHILAATVSWFALNNQV